MPPSKHRQACLALLVGGSLCLALSACGGQVSESPTSGAALVAHDVGGASAPVGDRPDAAWQTRDVVSFPEPDQGTVSEDTGPADPGRQDAGLSGPETTDEGAPSAGGFGTPCAENDDCPSGLCVPSAEGTVCTNPCIDDCPAGWGCRLLEAPSQDPTFVCMSRTVNLCRPCDRHAQCRELGGGPRDRCLHFGATEGSFCGTSCEDGRPCPEGFVCELLGELDTGEELHQCLPESGACECSSSATAAGASTTCGTGTCLGTRTCGEWGLSTCSAPEPLEESCNGLDDDCDAEVDEPFKDGALYVHHDHCGGCGRSCDGAVPNGSALCAVVGGEPACVFGGCLPGYVEDGAGGCEAERECEEDAGCEDADACTVDRCNAAGECLHEPLDCDDGDPCTADLCDSVLGCGHAPWGDGRECDDGDPCTAGDACGGGGCAGEALLCDDGNPCTADACEQGTCVNDPVEHTEPCYEGAAGEIGVGPCRQGTRSCADGVLGACVNQVLPGPERCDGLDNDCSGVPDEGCEIVGATVRPAAGHLAATRTGDGEMLETVVGLVLAGRVTDGEAGLCLEMSPYLP